MASQFIMKKGKKKKKTLTVSLAAVINLCKVLVAAAFMRAFGVVTDVGTDSKLQTLVLIWKMESHRKIMLKTRIVQECNIFHILNILSGACVCVPPQVWCPILWKPGLQEQKESVPLVTQWASSPSPH